MGISFHKSKRIPLLFLIGIGIPCLLLGYLAFRGIQNDQALLEKEKLNDNRKILELIARSVQENILTVEQTFLLALTKNQDDIYQPDLIRSIDSLKKQNPIVEEVFTMENFEEIHFPFAKLLFLIDGSTQSFGSSYPTSTLVRKATTGQQLEFQHKKYRQALASYQKDFKQTSDPQIKGELLSAIARVQKKSALFQDAVKTYEAIAGDYSNILTTGGVPLGLAAQSEISSLLMITGDTLAAIKTISDLYKDLINSRWMLERAQYDFFLQHLNESINNIFSQARLTERIKSYRNDFTVLKAEEQNQRKITERLLAFQENAGADLKAKIAPDIKESQSSARRFTLEAGENTYLVSLLGQNTGNENRGNEIRGAPTL